MTHGFSRRRSTTHSVPFDPPASHEGEVQPVPSGADADPVAASVALSTQWREAMLGFHRFG